MKDVIVRLNGGLGNQMFQYAFGKATARRYHARLLLDRSLLDLPSTPESYRLDAFNVAPHFTGAGQNWITRLLVSERLPPALQRSALAALSTRIVREGEVHATDAADPSDKLRRPRRMVLVGYFQRAAPLEGLEDELRNDFQRKSVDGPVSEMLQDIRRTQSVAVHIRRGDYVNVPLFRGMLGVLSRRYYVRAFEMMRQRLQSPAFFVFTDDPDWARREIAIGHRDVTVVDTSSARTDLDDMTLMRACAHFIVANSTFSWWPAFLSQHSAKIVIAPNPWFIDDDIGYAARVPTGWTALESDFER